MDYKIVLIIIAVLLAAAVKFKSLIFKAKDQAFLKEETKLKTEMQEIRAEVEKLKEPVKPQELSPAEVEDFWNKK